jgi:zinc transport system ATP-binding protein
VSEAGSPAIEIDGVTFSYGAAPVLEQVSLAVQRGEFLGLVGPNAGGKSTLLKLILGLLKPQTGRIKVLGRSPRQARKAIGYVPQYPAFARDFPITVEQAVIMGRLGTGSWLGGYGHRDRTAVLRALVEVEAENLARAQIGQISGGQLQRVLLARALAGDPEVLILDEPTANIDQRVEGEIFDLLEELNQRMTIVVVSHDIAFVSSYVRRVACLNRTLVCHRTDAINGQVIRELYGESVRMVAHRHYDESHA